MQKYVIALYIRLSIEDYKYDSLSIENQSLVLHEYAASMPEALNAEIMEFIDNGYSGTNFERPQVQKLIELVRANQIDCIIVKDFSRFGRNSIETGYFIERVFPLFHTRFISISDDFDSSKFKGDTGGMDVAFKYLISEYYSRDMSIKTKSAKYAKMQRGEYQSKICPYGYRKSADGRMEPDPEAAAVVQLIFQLAAEGINATAITRELFRRSIPTPGQYKAAHGNHTHDISRCHGIWSTSTILRILEDERYTGVYVIGKRAVLEVGGTRSRLKDRESWYIIPDHHPAIIEKAVFDTVQASQLRFSQPNKKKRDYPLKGKAFCGCCGHALSRTMQKPSYAYDRSPEYWTGWALAYYQWLTGLRFAEIEQAVSIAEVRLLYTPYHEMDVRQFADKMNELYRAAKPETNLKAMRTLAGLSQSELAGQADVPVRTIQQYEQRQKDINKAQAETLLRLARALNCNVEDLMEKVPPLNFIARQESRAT